MQRRIGRRIPGVAAHDVRDAITLVGLHQLQLGRQVAQGPLWRLAMVAVVFVGMRGAEFALQFPDQVGELGARGHALEQRLVAAQHGRPVDAGHVGHPEVVALQAPHLAQHLPPFEPGLDRCAHAAQVDPAALARRRVAVAGLGAPVLAMVHRDGAQTLAFAHQHGGVVGGDLEVVDLVHQRVGALAVEVEHLQPSRTVLVAAASLLAFDRQQGPQQLAHRRASQFAEAAFGHREGGDALCYAVQVDAHRLGGGRAGRLGLGLVAAREPLGLALEGRRPARLQRHQVGPRGTRETHLELHAVVHRVIGAQRQEVQEASLRVEGRAVVAELGLGHQRAALRGQLAQLDGALPGRHLEAVGQPQAIGRPGQVFAATGVAVVEHAHGACIGIAEQQLVAVVGHGHPRARRRGAADC